MRLAPCSFSGPSLTPFITHATPASCEGKRPPKGEFCEGCDGGKSPHLMLLCEQCDRAWHTFCLTPPLRKVPREAWTCPPCHEREAKKHAAAVKAMLKEERAREAAREPACFAAACEGGEEAEGKGPFLLCDTKGCPSEYHIGCLDPPLARVPKGDWYCPPCVRKRVAAEAAATKAAAEEAERRRPKVVLGAEGLAVGAFVVLREPDAADELPFTLARVEALPEPGSGTVALRAVGGCRRSRTKGLRFRVPEGEVRECGVGDIAAQVPCKADTPAGQAFDLLVSVEEVAAALEG